MPKHHIAGAAALLLVTAPAAWAEIDAQTLWSDWQEMATRFGGTLTSASEEYAGDTLTLTDVTMGSEVAGATSTSDYGTIRMVEQDDGSVRIELPSSISMTSTSTVGDTSVEQTTDTTSEGLEMVVREEDGIRTYDTDVDEMNVIIATTGAGEEEAQDVSVTLSGFSSTYRSGIGGDENAFESTMEGESLAIAVDGVPEAESFAFKDVMTGLAGTISGNFGEAPREPVKGLSDLGITYEGSITHSGAALTLAGEGPRGPYAVDWTDEAGEMTFDLGEDSLSYGLGGTGSAATLRLPGLPLPVDLSMAESSLGIALPFGEPGDAKPFAFGLAFQELKLDDALWGLFDPTGQLPRDPATLVLDLDGTAAMKIDLFGDPAAMAGLGGAPGDLETLNLNEILLSAAGAELRGSGTLEFPEVTPVPEPVGTIELALDGGFALADRLVALGLLPQQQATFIKGMTGAVARSVGDDQLESTIEFTPGGGISANGLPLR